MPRAEAWFRLAGKRCTCPPRCTTTHWGSGAVDCDKKCEPCRIMKGKLYVPPG